MRLNEIIAILVTLAAVFSYLNHRFLRLAPTAGLMLLSLASSVFLVALEHFGIAIAKPVEAFVRSIDFNRFLLDGILSFLLFAGALVVDIEELRDVKWDVAAFALLGVVISTLAVGFAVFGLSLVLGLGLSAVYCFLFGAGIVWPHFVAGLAVIPVVLVARFAMVKILAVSLPSRGDYERHDVLILTWIGVRAGIPIALALSLPLGGGERQTLIVITYMVVVFSMLAQSTTVQVPRTEVARNRQTHPNTRADQSLSEWGFSPRPVSRMMLTRS